MIVNVVINMHFLLPISYTQVEGINFEETFAPVAWLEAIRMTLVFASYKVLNFFKWM